MDFDHGIRCPRPAGARAQHRTDRLPIVGPGTVVGTSSPVWPGRATVRPVSRAIQEAHRQADQAVRFEWGPTGAEAVGERASYAVVIDVLSFTTTLSLAVERGLTVFPYRWRDHRAAEYTRSRDAVLAIGRLEARSLKRGLGVSLSPAGMAAVTAAEAARIGRIVLPSPNGSTIAYGLRESGAVVVGGCLRNAEAVGELAGLAAGGRRDASCGGGRGTVAGRVAATGGRGSVGCRGRARRVCRGGSDRVQSRGGDGSGRVPGRTRPAAVGAGRLCERTGARRGRVRGRCHGRGRARRQSRSAGAGRRGVRTGDLIGTYFRRLSRLGAVLTVNG